MEVRHKDFTTKKPDQLVYLELGAGNGGMLLSISEDGFRFRAVSPVRASGTMPFAFSLDGSHRLEGSGTVEWLEEDGKSGGMRFTQVSGEFRAVLNGWLSQDPSRHSPGREAMPAADNPLDTMEKIRRELRSGYPARPRPAEPAAQSPTARSKISETKIEEKIPDRTPKSVLPERKVEPKETPAARPTFPLPAPEKEKPESVSSAFLKRPSEAKPRPAVPVGPVTPASPVSAAAPVTLPVPAVPLSSVKPEDAHVPSPSRPFIPPLEDSFEQAWERAKLSAPPDSPHLSRAAAGSIIAVALAVILVALAYNFRQGIGDAFIELGQSISGDKRASAPTGETKPQNQPASQQGPPQRPEAIASQPPSASTEKEKAAAPNSTSPVPDGASAAVTKGAGAAKNGTTSSHGSPQGPGFVAVPSPVKPRENSTAQLLADAGAKEITPAELGTGQEEFNSAREILRGNNRERDLWKAVNLLWAGVRKGYVPAEVTLADLFRRGDGVEKNCDQARVLLVAASKKGSLDARQMLEQIAEHGCE